MPDIHETRLRDGKPDIYWKMAGRALMIEAAGQLIESLTPLFLITGALITFAVSVDRVINSPVASTLLTGVSAGGLTALNTSGNRNKEKSFEKNTQTPVASPDNVIALTPKPLEPPTSVPAQERQRGIY